MFTYALITADGEALGPVVFAESLRVGQVITNGDDRCVRVVNVIEADRDGDLPLLVVEVDGDAPTAKAD